MLFHFKGYDSSGAISTQSVEARNSEEAALLNPFAPRRRISGPSRSVAGNLVSEMTKARLSQDQQAVILAQLGGAIESGQSANKTLIRLMAEDRNLKKQIPKVERMTLVSERLEALEFDFQAVLMAQIGERTNTLGPSLLDANETLLWRRDVLAELRKGLLGRLFMIVFAVAMLLGMSMFMAHMTSQFTEGTNGLKMEINPGLQIMLSINAIVTAYWWAFVAVGLLIVSFRKRLLALIDQFPVLSVLSEYLKLQRGMRFLTAYKPLFDVGVPITAALEQLIRASRGSDKRIYSAMLDRMRRINAPLSRLIDRSEMPKILRQGFRGFEDKETGVQERVMSTQLRLLQAQTRMTLGRIKVVLMTLSLITVAAVILLMAMGYLAMSSLSPDMGI